MRLAQKVGRLAATRVRTETIDCWERGRPVRTEREARKTLIVFDIGNNAPPDRMRTGRPRSQH